MSMIKKLIALSLALAMVLSVSAFAGYSADGYADADKISADCADAIELMYALDIMKGNEKGEFMPTKAVTRAEMAKMIYVILNYGNDDKAVTYKGGTFFTDVPATHWAEGYINYCAATKLIAGRGDGKFYPDANVTTAEAAKMLLTAIGYSAEARGYVGDKWADNVLSDAAAIGLLDGYKANVPAAAPRQWIAVMLENMLLDALTYVNMVPAFSGLLTSGYDTGIVPVGYKYYGVKSFSSVAYATENALIDGDELASEDTVLFANELEIEGTGIKAADLGQEYKVIYNEKTMEAYSVRSLADVDTARVYDMEVDIKHATSGNAPANKYVFTIGDIEATLKNGEVKYLTSTNENGTIDVETLYALIEDDNYSANTLKAIDSDANGVIDYFYITKYDYGYVTEVATSNKYGKYINVVKPGTEVDEDEYIYLTFNTMDDYNLYLKDTVITADEIEEEDIVKVSHDIESGKHVIEVLPSVNAVEYKAYDDKNDIFVLGSKEYHIAETEYGADWGDVCEEYLLDEDYLGEKLNIVYDGDLIVFVWEDDGRYDNMDDVNEQLVLVLDAEYEYSNTTIREKEAIEYMTIDGKTHIAVYDVDTTAESAVDFETIYALSMSEDVEYTEENRLFKLKAGTKGRVYLERLDAETINDQLNVKPSVLNGYEEGSDYYLNAKTASVTMDDYKVATNNKYFVGSFDDGEPVYTVMTLQELRKCYDKEAYGQILTYENDKGTRTTVVGGYLFLDLSGDDESPYLYIEKIGRKTAAGRTLEVVFHDGKRGTILLDNDCETELVKDILYRYNYNFMNDDYSLSIVTMDEQDDEIVDLDEEKHLWFDHAGRMEDALEEEVIAILNIVVERDQTQIDNGDDAPEFELDLTGIKFVKLKDLKLSMIENDIDVDEETYTQYTDYRYDVEDLLYVANFHIMNTAQNISDNLPELLEEILDAVLAGEKKITFTSPK